jgi:hypothetical protein
MSMTRYQRTRVPALSFFALALPLFAACGDNIIPTVPIECGNGIVQEGEACDDGAASPYCNDDCTLAECGDGKLSLDEDCDDAGESAACNADCTLAECGDGMINATAGEACDDVGVTANCNADCTATSCGDGIVNMVAGEECDGDGAGTGGETAECNSDCTFSYCGDGIVNMLTGEECDGDGAGTGGETTECNSNCTVNFCGDGVINAAAGEDCDDTNLGGAECRDIGTLDSGTLACNATCTFDTSACGECGNGVLDGAEECDDLDVGAATCGDFPPYDNGALGCSIVCTIDTAGCGECGNGVADGDEECDGADLGGANCSDIPPNIGGTLGCNAAACAFDVAQCILPTIVQNDDGVCAEEIGCTSGDGSSGNPNELVECFTTAETPPFALYGVQYEVGASVPAPGSLFVDVYEWTGVGLPGVVLESVPLPVTELAAGAHSVTLATPLTVTSSTFCIGINGTDPADGYRLTKSQTISVPDSSFIKASTCGANGYTPMSDIGFPGNWCIRGAVGPINP